MMFYNQSLLLICPFVNSQFQFITAFFVDAGIRILNALWAINHIRWRQYISQKLCYLPTKQCYNTEDNHWHFHSRENLRSRNILN
jgi:hypothetical protein